MGGPVLEQPSDGYRYCVDPFLLADFFVPRGGPERILDMGCGVGVVGLVIARLWRDVSIVGVEIQRRLFEYARRNAVMSGLTDRVEVLHGDFREISRFIPPGTVTSVVSNPPFRPIGAGRISRHREAAVARHEIYGGVTDVIEGAAAVLGEGGRIFLVYPARRWMWLSHRLSDAGFRPTRIRFVHPRPNAAAHLVLAEAAFRTGGASETLPPLVIYDGNGEYSEEVGKLFAKLTPHCY